MKLSTRFWVSVGVVVSAVLMIHVYYHDITDPFFHAIELCVWCLLGYTVILIVCLSALTGAVFALKHIMCFAFDQIFRFNDWLDKQDA